MFVLLCSLQYIIFLSLEILDKKIRPTTLSKFVEFFMILCFVFAEFLNQIFFGFSGIYIMYCLFESNECLSECTCITTTNNVTHD